ncbi:MAG: transcription elongation factor NusA [Candidatus Altiarchaeota archaeon]
MSLPICDLCAKTGILCGACEDKLEKGKIKELDITLSKMLFEIGEGSIGFDRAIETDDVIVILTQRKDIGKIIGKGGANIRMLTEKLGKPVRVIGVGDLRSTIHDFIAPAQVIGISNVYKPDGSTIQRVKVNKKDKAKLRMSLENVRKLVSSLTDDEVEITFD